LLLNIGLFVLGDLIQKYSKQLLMYNRKSILPVHEIQKKLGKDQNVGAVSVIYDFLNMSSYLSVIPKNLIVSLLLSDQRKLTNFIINCSIDYFDLFLSVVASSEDISIKERLCDASLVSITSNFYKFIIPFISAVRVIKTYTTSNLISIFIDCGKYSLFIGFVGYQFIFNRGAYSLSSNVRVIDWIKQLYLWVCSFFMFFKKTELTIVKFNLGGREITDIKHFPSLELEAKRYMGHPQLKIIGVWQDIREMNLHYHDPLMRHPLFVPLNLEEDKTKKN